MPEESDDFTGLDGWRRVVRTIDVNLPQRLEELRIEARGLTSKHIKALEHLPAGIVHFQSTLKEIKGAGGLGYTSSQEMESDLLSILPEVIREDQSIPHDALNGVLDFKTCKNTVVQQAARLLFERRRGGGGVYAVGPEPPQVEPTDEEDFINNFGQDGSVKQALNRFNGQKRPGHAGPRRAPQARQELNGGGAACGGHPRLCLDCSKQHPGRGKEKPVDYKGRGMRHMRREAFGKRLPQKASESGEGHRGQAACRPSRLTIPKHHRHLHGQFSPQLEQEGRRRV